MNAEPIALGWNELAGAIRTKTTLPADQMELLESHESAFPDGPFSHLVALVLYRFSGLRCSMDQLMCGMFLPLCRGCFTNATKMKPCCTASHPRNAHAPLGLAGGLTSADLHAIRTIPPLSASNADTSLTPLYSALLEFADHSTRNVFVPASVFTKLKGLLENNDRKMVEVTTTVAGYNFSTRVLRALDVAGLGETEVPVPELD